MTDPNETASLIGSLIDGYREHAAAERVPGQVRGRHARGRRRPPG